MPNILLGIGALSKFIPNFINIVFFVAANLVYILLMRYQLNQFIKEKGKKPMHFKLFRIYHGFFLRKVVSRSERQLYVRSNWITIIMGIIILGTFGLVVYKMFH